MNKLAIRFTPAPERLKASIPVGSERKDFATDYFFKAYKVFIEWLSEQDFQDQVERPNLLDENVKTNAFGIFFVSAPEELMGLLAKAPGVKNVFIDNEDNESEDDF